MKRAGFRSLMIVAGAALVGGCGPAGSMRLLQPRLQGWQRELSLESDQIHWAGAGDTKTERVLAEFPLPGARTGKPAYLLYLRLPAGESNVGFDAKGASGGRGFLIQTSGQYAGLARLTGGTVAVSGNSKAERAKRTLQLNIECEDGSRIVGKVEATRDEYGVSRFETRQRPADVRLLVQLAAATSAPAH